MLRALRFCPLLVLAGAAVATGAGCTLSPQPEPPNIDLGRIRVVPEDPTSVVIPGVFGGPGSIAPPSGVVRVFDLDSTEPRAEGAVRDDGSFEVVLIHQSGQELRMQLHTSTARSAPIDLVAPERGGPGLPAPRPLGDCLRVVTELAIGSARVGASAVASFDVINACSADIVLDATRLRVPLTEIAVAEPPTPATLAPGMTHTVTLTFTPVSTIELEEIVLVQAVAPESDRRAITIRASTVPE